MYFYGWVEIYVASWWKIMRNCFTNPIQLCSNYVTNPIQFNSYVLKKQSFWLT